jgi:hypothetical protein
MNKKIIWGVVIVLIVVLAGLVVKANFFPDLSKRQVANCCDGSQQKAAMDSMIADWKTYTNEKYGFNFKYPTDWVIEGGVSDISVGVWRSKAWKKGQDEIEAGGLLGGSNGPDLAISYCDSACYTQIRKDWNADAVTSIQDIFKNRYAQSFEETIVDGRKAYMWVEVSSIDRNVIYVPFPQGGYFLSEPEHGDVKVTQGIKQIISTFKFTSTPAATSQPSIKVISPNGGEKYKGGDTINITWNSSGFDSSLVNLYLLRTDEGQTSRLASGIRNTGSYMWTIPKTISVNATTPYIISVHIVPTGGQDGIDNVNSDESDMKFTITN